MTTQAARHGIERFANALRGVDEGAVEDGHNRRRLVETGIRLASARPEGMIDGVFRVAFLHAGFESGRLCRKIALGRANRELRKSPDGFGLHHGLRYGCAAPEPAAVAGATLPWTLGVPRGRIGMCTPSQPSAGGRSGPAILPGRVLSR